MSTVEIKATIITYKKTYSLNTFRGVKLRDLLDTCGISYSLPCGGSGRCGRCKVRFVQGAPETNSYDKEHLTGEEREQGYRLLCCCSLENDCTIEIESRLSEETMRVEEISSPGEISFSAEGDLGVAIDLGTTTIAAALIKTAASGYEVLKTASCVNRQRKYGDDVISRIAAAGDPGVAGELKRLVTEDIEGLIKSMLQGSLGETELKAITIAGNTTMLHLLRGYDVTGLGRYPYTPFSTKLEKMDSREIFSNIKNLRLTLLPGISAFVGADIVAGLFSLSPNATEKYFFLDLGTNGEMAFYDGESLRVTSAAAGPVFEAVGISCGVACVPGAISHVAIDATTHKTEIDTIKEASPIGLCGTAVCEITSELARCGIIDETGLLSDEYFDEGFPVTADRRVRFTQQDIRNVQLAKAAILTGANALLNGAEPDRVYVAGGFGTNLFPEKIVGLKMFPKEFDGKIVSVGNTSLKGAAMYTAAVLSGDEKTTAADALLGQIRAKAHTVELAAIDSFDEAYLCALDF